MLGRLKMTVDECLEHYQKFMKEIFTQRWFSGIKNPVKIGFGGSKYGAEKLKEVIKNLIKERTGQDADTVTLMDDESQKDSCKV